MRREDWPARLNDTVAAWAGRPFSWGETDCCLFAAACVEAVTGEDKAQKFRGQYTSALGAHRVLQRHGGVDGLMRNLGYEPAPVPMAQRGDIVAIEQDRDLVLAVCVGGHVLCQGPEGLRRYPLGDGVKAWRV